MPTTVAAVRQDVQEWIDRRGLKVSKYGTVRLVKVVEADGLSRNRVRSSGSRLRYEPGDTVVAPDYEPTAECGKGLHFAATAREAQNSVSCSSPRYLVCDVDAESMVLIDEQKVKARFCHVRFEGDETDFGRFV
jgi:hypothetical protein